jgi:hypothetical protein
MIEIIDTPFIQGAFMLLPFVGMALSTASKMVALERDNYKCQWQNVDCCGQLEAAHIDHSRRDVNGIPYDDPSRAIMLCTRHHLDQHLAGFGNNGLSVQGNNAAIHSLKCRLRSFGMEI